MAASIDAIVAAFELARRPTVGDVFNRTFLPPKSERSVPNVGN